MSVFSALSDIRPPFALNLKQIQGDFALLDDLFGSKARETAAAVNLRVLDLSNNNITYGGCGEKGGVGWRCWFFI